MVDDLKNAFSVFAPLSSCFHTRICSPSGVSGTRGPRKDKKRRSCLALPACWFFFWLEESWKVLSPSSLSHCVFPCGNLPATNPR